MSELTDLSAARQFLMALAGDAGGWTIQTFDDAAEKRSELVRQFHPATLAAFDKLVPALLELNERGAGVFVAVNRTDLRGRRAENVTGLRAVCVDGDDVAQPNTWHQMPDLVVTRDVQRWHAYWLVQDGEALGQFTPAQKRLAIYYGTDPAVCDLPRVMRLPGFLHCKAEPCALKLAIVRQGPRRSLAEILEGLPELPELREPTRATIPAAPGDQNERMFAAWAAKAGSEAVEGRRNATVFRIACEGCGRGLPEAFVLSVCRQHANGLSDAEVAQTVHSAFRRERGANQPKNQSTTASIWTPTQKSPDALWMLDKELDDAAAGRRYPVALPWTLISTDARCLLPGTVTLLCGSPGATKSFALVQALRHFSASGIPAAGLLLEDGRAFHLRRAMAQTCGNASITDDGWCRQNPQRLAAYRKESRPLLEKLEACIDELPDSVPPTAQNLLRWMESKLPTHRVLAVDPATLMVRGRQGWTDDEAFLFGAKRLVEKHGASLIVLTHPRRLQNGQRVESMDDLAGGACYSRFSQTILYLRAHAPKAAIIRGTMGTSSETINRTIMIFKARNGRGVEGQKYGCFFDPASLTLRELGRIESEE